MIQGILDTACQQGFLYAIAALGIVITLRIMNWPDLTVDGSFTLGGAVLGVLLTRGVSPIFATAAAAAAGFCAGAATAILNRKLGISRILSGILVMLILYSVNLRIMGKANISLLRQETLFSGFDANGPGDPLRMLCYLGIVIFAFAAMCYLFQTRLGLFLRAAGDNEFMVQGLGVNTNPLFLISLGLGNALVAAAGALVAQHQGFADIGMGTGLIITGIAAVIIGESLIAAFRSLRKPRFPHRETTAGITPRLRLLPWKVFADLAAAIVGSFAYFVVVAACLRMGLEPTDLRLATGLLVILGISLRLRGPVVETYAKGRM